MNGPVHLRVLRTVEHRNAGGLSRLLAVAVLVMAGTMADVGCTGMCGNDVITEAPSPGGSVRAIVFERDCGATTDFSTQVSVLPSGKQLADEGGNVFTADTNHGVAPAGPKGGPEVRIRWEDSRHLLVQHHSKARVFRAEPRVGDIEVRYDRFE